MSPFPEEHELIGLFESEPILQDKNAPWAYNHLAFSRVLGRNIIQCEIEPGYETFKFRWLQNAIEIMNLDLHWVSRLSIETKPGMEALIVHCRKSEILPLRIQFRPSIHVSWGTPLQYP